VVRHGSDGAIKRGRITKADGVFRKQGDAERVAKQTVHNIVSDEGRSQRRDGRCSDSDTVALTKLNFNACIFGDGLPVTLRFADDIGQILTAIPEVRSQPLPLRHYI
jgi:hypothetical protein